MNALRVFMTYGRAVYECPTCGSFTMADPDGSWACRGCAGSVMVHVEQMVTRPGFRPVKVRRSLMVAMVTT